MKTPKKLIKRKSQALVPAGFVVVLLSVVILLGQAFPAMSKTSSMWIEICGDGGSYLAEIETSEGEPTQECAHCEICTLPVFDSYEMAFAGGGESLPLAIKMIGWVSLLSDNPENPEQYWSACRGPPLVDVDKKMIPTRASFYEEYAGRAINLWGAPWL